MISVFGSNFNDAEVEAVIKPIKDQWVGIGKYVKEFEKKFADHLDQNDFVLVDSGSNALFMAVKLLDLPPQSEIIIPSFTWVSCAQAILMAGHHPVFCDVEIDTQNVSIETIVPHITKKTKAIMVVHYAGKPVNIDPILELGIPVIEDTAHAVDSMYHGKACGTLGDIGVFSFDSIKNLAMGEGGGIIANDPEKLEIARKMRYCGIGKSGFQQASQESHGRWWEYDIGDPFIKMLPTDVEASLGLVQLSRLNENQKRRKAIWDIYQEAFHDVDWITRPGNAEAHEKHSYFTYFTQTPKRDQLANYLLENKIYTTLRYHPLHLNRVFKSSGKLPNSEKLNEVGLNIPLHPRLTDEEVTYVIDKIKSFPD
ncbi:DegT/DnrJ/EryC1/StrS family aminotransferase [Ekhidna sp.]|uniref:DegT/DnrJ/EryC1/StrS family aminotransferase n=1 Tax=Ekhidna sp. TaxID=2608089 RepID=UPI003B5997CA